MTLGSIPGTWQEGDDPGERKFIRLTGDAGAGFALELGASLPEVTVAYETWGEPRRDGQGAVTNAVLVLDIAFDALDPEQPDVTSKDRPVLVVAGSRHQLLVRPIYSNTSPARRLFQPWRRLGLDHASYIDDARVTSSFTSVNLQSQLGQLTNAEWNALS